MSTIPITHEITELVIILVNIYFWKKNLKALLLNCIKSTLLPFNVCIKKSKIQIAIQKKCFKPNSPVTSMYSHCSTLDFSIGCDLIIVNCTKQSSIARNLIVTLNCKNQLADIRCLF